MLVFHMIGWVSIEVDFDFNLVYENRLLANFLGEAHRYCANRLTRFLLDGFSEVTFLHTNSKSNVLYMFFDRLTRGTYWWSLLCSSTKSFHIPTLDNELHFFYRIHLTPNMKEKLKTNLADFRTTKKFGSSLFDKFSCQQDPNKT
jgi:hypothetical protein